MSKFKVETSQSFLVSTTARSASYKLTFDAAPKQPIGATVEVRKDNAPVGTVTYLSEKDDFALDFSANGSTLHFRVSSAPKGRYEAVVTVDDFSETMIFDAKGYLDFPNGTPSTPVPAQPALRSLIESMSEFHEPLQAALGASGTPNVVYQASSSGSESKPTKDQCNATYVNKVKGIAGRALQGAAFGAGLALGGPLGAFAGLVVVAGTYIDTKSSEKTAQEERDKCIADAPS